MRQRFEKVYQVFCPGCNLRFTPKWFGEKLREHGIERHRVTVSRWVNGKVSMPHEAWEVLITLESDARKLLQDRQEELG